MSDDLTKANTSKYLRPRHIEHLSNDQVVAAMLRLTMEISVVRERLATCESLLREHGVFDQGAIDGYQKTAAEAAERAADRVTLIEQVIGDLT